MNINITEIRALGTSYKKEDIFLAMVTPSIKESKETLQDATNGELEEDVLDMLMRLGAISTNQPEVVVKSKEGYIYFTDDGTKAIAVTMVGDNSDGKGYVSDVVSAWDYFNEKDFFEAKADGIWMIAIETSAQEKIYRYNEEHL